MQLVHALLGLPHPLGPLEQEWLCDNADSQHAKVARRLGNDRGGARARAAAHSGGDEAHVRAGQVLDDFLDGFLGSGGPDLGARARAQPLGDLHSHLNADSRVRLLQRLRIGVGHDEINAVQLLVDHVVDGVAPRSAYAEHSELGFEFLPFREI